jgi:DnaJ-class molecular chaperone
MAKDYYNTLGVSRNASQTEIQKAYRDLARKYHPDLNPDDKQAKQKFQEVQEAFDVLNDAKKREMYDRYGSSFQQGGGAPGGGPGGTWTFTGDLDDVDLSQFFGERFGGGGAGAGSGAGGFAEMFKQFGGAAGAAGAGRTRSRRRPPQQGADVEAELEIPFAIAVVGGETHVTLQRGGQAETLAIKIPAGIEDGKKMRLRGQGEPGIAGGPPGDVLLTIRVAPHPFFMRQGKNLLVKVAITLGEAVSGAKVDVPAPRGTLSLRVPPGSSSGAKLRAKGQGVAPKDEPPGDLIAELQIVLPPTIDDQSKEVLADFDHRNPMNPRATLKW